MPNWAQLNLLVRRLPCLLALQHLPHLPHLRLLFVCLKRLRP
jgi:hypothetical protein